MTLNYPNGQHYSQKQSNTFKAKHKSPSRIVYGNRGMTLEQEINDSNQYYLEREIAVIHKKPIPIQIVDVDYPRRSAAVIKKAYFKTPSTTDYNGIRGCKPYSILKLTSSISFFGIDLRP